MASCITLWTGGFLYRAVGGEPLCASIGDQARTEIGGCSSHACIRIYNRSRSRHHSATIAVAMAVAIAVAMAAA